MGRADRAMMEDEILKFIYEYHDEHQWAPSYREIMAAVGLTTSSTLMCRIHRLGYDGYLSLGGGARTIAVTEKGLERIGVV